MAASSTSHTPEGDIRAIAVFGKCYDERTARLAASLARRGIGPKKAAIANLSDLEQKMSDFTATALSDTNPPGDGVKAAYAALYEKQFRYEFYESYEEKASKQKVTPKPAAATAPPPKKAGTPVASVTTPPTDVPAKPTPEMIGVPSAPAATTKPSTPPSSPAAAAPDASATASSLPPAESSASKEVDPFTKAKNHFGELLGALPPEKIHEVHSAFGKLFNGNPVSEDLKVDIYKYAIFLLEGPKDKPFAPPPL